MSGYPDLRAQISNIEALLEEWYRDLENAKNESDIDYLNRTIAIYENKLKGLYDRLEGFDGMNK